MSAPEASAFSELAAAYSERDFKLPDGERVDFHLTFEGELKGARGGADHVHEIRKVFHPQLRKLWRDHPLLINWPHPEKPSQHNPERMVDYLAEQFKRNGYRFVPLAMSKYSAVVTLDILFLRSGIPGTILSSADLDARLKTLVDALRMPSHQQELGANLPNHDEDPFFCLMEDDKLVGNMSIQTDALLQTTSSDGLFHKHDARVVIKVKVGTYVPFAWNHPFT